MAGESITFDFVGRGAGQLASDFKKTGDNAVLAAKGARLCADALDKQKKAADVSAGASLALARADDILKEAEHGLAEGALEAEFALKREAAAAKQAGRDATTARTGFAGLAGEVTGFGAAAAAATSGGNKFKLALAGLNLASGVLEPVMAGVVVAAGGLAAGFASAGAGLGAFGIVAKSVYSQASAAATAYAAAQQKYSTATTSKQRTAALQAEKNAMTGLSAPVKTLAIELGNTKNLWKAFTDAAAPGVVGVLSQGIGILTSHFGILKQFLPPVEVALSHILAHLNTGLNSAGFKSFTGALAANTGPAIEKIATAIGHVIVGIGGILKAFLPTSQSMLSGIDRITGAFAKWGTTLSQHSGFQSLMKTFRTQTPQAVQILKNLGTVLLNVGKAMFGLSTFSNSKLLLQALLPLSGVLASLSKNTGLDRIALYLYAASTAAGKLKPAMTALFGVDGEGGIIRGAKAAVTWIGNMTKAMLGLDAAANANVIGLIVIAIAALAAAFAIAWKKSAAFRDVIKEIGKALLEAGIIIVRADKFILDSFLSMVGAILHGAADAFGWIPGLGSKLRGASRAFDSFKTGVDGAFNHMIGTMRGWQGELSKSGRAVDSLRTRNLGPLQGSLARTSGGVQGLQHYINLLHGKTVNVGAHLSGSGGVQVTPSTGAPGAKNYAVYFKPLATGGRIPGFGGGDQHPALLEAGEAVVDKYRTRRFAPVLKAMGVPGMTAGGLVGNLAADTGTDVASEAKAGLGAIVTELRNALRAAAQAAASKAAGLGNLPLGRGPLSGSAAIAQAFARSILWAYGWGPGQFPPLQALWNQESGWNAYAVNPSSGAYGIPQALGKGHPFNLGDYQAQIRWGLAYISQRYGSPSAAEAHELAYHWYDKGGWLMPGVTMAVNNTGRPEQVIPAGGTAAAGGNVTVVLENRGVIGSEQELRDWLSRSINNLARTGQLTYALRRSPSAG
jgi:hypothetical protein